MRSIILASTSPRRKKFMEALGVNFSVKAPLFEESLHTDEFSYALIENLAFQKAHSVVQEIKTPAIVIAADTLVIFGGKILGKPHSLEEAKKMLKLLSGHKHSVVTALCVLNTYDDTIARHSEMSVVEFNNISADDIENYVNEFKPLDKAGAYGIQELPEGFVKSCEGSVENVIGLPLDALSKILIAAKAI